MERYEQVGSKHYKVTTRIPDGGESVTLRGVVPAGGNRDSGNIAVTFPSGRTATVSLEDIDSCVTREECDPPKRRDEAP